MKRLTREWLQKADADLEVARREFAARPTYHDIVCFHCQQAVEKLLKGFLQEHGATFLKTHDLKILLEKATDIDPAIKPLQHRIRPLTRYAVEYRYPGLAADRRKSRRALAVAERVRNEVRHRLGLRP